MKKKVNADIPMIKKPLIWLFYHWEFSHLAVEGPELAAQLDALSSIVVKYCLNK